MDASGSTTNFAPCPAASSTNAIRFFLFAATSPRSDEHCTAATRTVAGHVVGSAANADRTIKTTSNANAMSRCVMSFSFSPYERIWLEHERERGNADGIAKSLIILGTAKQTATTSDAADFGASDVQRNAIVKPQPVVASSNSNNMKKR
jgi:hypothetical protein